MEKLDLKMALQTAKRAAHLGREVLLDYFGQLKRVQEKAYAGLVSEADVESERVITQELARGLPGVSIVAEEEAFARQSESISATSWVVDPLDGTTNYVHGFHVFCVSIGLQWRGELAVGVVDVPILDKVYEGARGEGAFVNGQPLRVSSRQRIQDSLLATGFFPDNTPALREQLKIFSELVYEARGIRRAGAAAYDLCLVAEGVFDAFWEKNLKPWDACAGALLVREAGGLCRTYEGADYKLGCDSLLAGNPVMVDLVGQRILALSSP